MQWEVNIHPEHSTKFVLEKYQEEKNISRVEQEIISLSHICYAKDSELMTVSSVSIFPNNQTELFNCTEIFPENAYFSALRDYEEELLCKDQYSIVYVNGSADYMQSYINCFKIHGGNFLSQEDLRFYRHEIDSINGLCDTDGVKSWILTESERDFSSWCRVLMTNGSLLFRPCQRSLNCSLCKIKAGQMVWLFGQLENFDRNYTLKTTQKGEMYLKGHKTSLLKEINNNWVLKSSLHDITCFNNESDLPFVRLNWTCGSDTRLLALSPCRFNQFACDSGECTQEEFRCNGVGDCVDGSDETNCAQFIKSPGYDIEQIPPILPDYEKINVEYYFTVHSIDDIKTSNFYAEVDLSIGFIWRDSRLELWDPKQASDVDCRTIWRPDLLLTDAFEKGHWVSMPEKFRDGCSAEVDGFGSLKKIVTDPYMGKKISL